MELLSQDEGTLVRYDMNWYSQPLGLPDQLPATESRNASGQHPMTRCGIALDELGSDVFQVVENHCIAMTAVHRRGMIPGNEQDVESG